MAVIFTSRRLEADPQGYAAAAAEMETLAAIQPGFCGIESARGADGFGITVSWWADEEAAVAWRRNADHAAIRARGREDWYDTYEVAVGRSYHWSRG